jgi:hypothetical protein
MIAEFRECAEFNRFRGTRLGASRHEVILLPVVAESTFVSTAILLIPIQNTKRTRHYAICTAVADVLLHIYVPEFVIDEGAGRTNLHTRSKLAMFADIAHHEPAFAMPSPIELFDKSDMTPRCVGQSHRIVVAITSPLKSIGRQLVPLFAGYFAGLAPDAERSIREEPCFFLLRGWLGFCECLNDVRGECF